ncbi:MAG TPA: hypothetical protein DIC36_00940 [Gammaproteobacteria bacterium]|nr:hypothetical protein [Gammaproteobacteria bacterium]
MDTKVNFAREIAYFHNELERVENHIHRLSTELLKEQELNRLFRMSLLVMLILIVGLVYFGNDKLNEIRAYMPTAVRESIHLEMIQHLENWADWASNPCQAQNFGKN